MNAHKYLRSGLYDFVKYKNIPAHIYLCVIMQMFF